MEHRDRNDRLGGGGGEHRLIALQSKLDKAGELSRFRYTASCCGGAKAEEDLVGGGVHKAAVSQVPDVGGEVRLVAEESADRCRVVDGGVAKGQGERLQAIELPCVRRRGAFGPTDFGEGGGGEVEGGTRRRGECNERA